MLERNLEPTGENSIHFSVAMNTNWHLATYSKYLEWWEAEITQLDIQGIKRVLLDSTNFTPIEKEEIFLGLFHFPDFGLENNRPELTIPIQEIIRNYDKKTNGDNNRLYPGLSKN